MNIKDCTIGTRVLYQPVIGREPAFEGVVREEPWKLGDGTWVTHVSRMEAAYGNYVGVPGKTTVYAAHIERALRKAP